MGRSGKGTERREREGGTQGREQERKRGREWDRDPQSKSRGLTGAKGGWWVRADVMQHQLMYKEPPPVQCGALRSKGGASGRAHRPRCTSTRPVSTRSRPRHSKALRTAIARGWSKVFGVPQQTQHTPLPLRPAGRKDLAPQTCTQVTGAAGTYSAGTLATVYPAAAYTAGYTGVGALVAPGDAHFADQRQAAQDSQTGTSYMAPTSHDTDTSIEHYCPLCTA